MNKSITAIIVDDQASCIKTLCSDLTRYPQIQVVETFTSPEKAKNAILKQQPDLLFLDVEMPKINGFELLNEIRSSIHSQMCVVFYSAFDKYMLEALRASAFDYLLKPYSLEELDLIIKRITDKLESGDVNFEQSIRRLLANDRRFAIYTITGLLLLRCSDILHFRYSPETRYWQMTLANLTVHKLRQNTTAKEILSISSVFAQVSQDCILNIDYLASIENKTYRCVFYPPFNDFDIHVSRRYYSKIKEILEII